MMQEKIGMETQNSNQVFYVTWKIVIGVLVAVLIAGQVRADAAALYFPDLPEPTNLVVEVRH